MRGKTIKLIHEKVEVFGEHRGVRNENNEWNEENERNE